MKHLGLKFFLLASFLNFCCCSFFEFLMPTDSWNTTIRNSPYSDYDGKKAFAYHDQGVVLYFPERMSRVNPVSLRLNFMIQNKTGCSIKLLEQETLLISSAEATYRHEFYMVDRLFEEKGTLLDGESGWVTLRYRVDNWNEFRWGRSTLVLVFEKVPAAAQTGTKPSRITLKVPIVVYDP